jgi:hypothetical protein
MPPPDEPSAPLYRALPELARRIGFVFSKPCFPPWDAYVIEKKLLPQIHPRIRLKEPDLASVRIH